MSDLSDVCALCKPQISAEFSVGPRTTKTISGDVLVSGSCFVADEIIFTGKGKLIFTPNIQQPNCAVVCRKLTVTGGNPPVTVNPCNPGDPGTRYNTNVITWEGRLTSAPAGPPVVPPNAAVGSSPGANGAQGSIGNTGGSGSSPGQKGREGQKGTLTVIAIEVEFATGANLVIDYAGQDGGDGGDGQNGGPGAKGSTGSDGSDASWPSSGCDTATGNGGDGGDGGNGGIGGTGGNGGNAGQIIVITTAENKAGVFSNPALVTFVTQSIGGKGGKGGHGGTAGPGGNSGKPTSDCGLGSKGDPGNSLISIVANPGAGGSAGASSSPNFDLIDGSACSNTIPRQLVLATAVPLATFIRCSSGSSNGTVSVTGQFLDQITSVTCSLSGVTATIKNSSTDTQLDLAIAIAANSATGTGDLIFHYSSPFPAQTLTGAVIVEITQATGISPNTGAKGDTITTVTITGTGFDPTAPNHNVSVSGLGVNVVNVALVDDSSMTCTFEITATAQAGARDVTVTAGPALGACQFTLVGAFTVI
jgi:IPT/TIG domain